MTEHSERDFWTQGRRGCTARVSITVYPRSIVAMADSEHITPRMVKRALKKEFPQHVFHLSTNGSVYIRADADRFTDDGV